MAATTTIDKRQVQGELSIASRADHLVRPRGRPRAVIWVSLILTVAVSSTVASLVAVSLATPASTGVESTAPAQPAIIDAPEVRLEDRLVQAASTSVYGDASFRGGPGRAGVVPNSGVREVGGIYWRLRPGGSVVGSAVAYGRFLYVATDENRLYGFEVDRGRTSLLIQTDSPITATPAVAKSDVEETDPLVVFATADGIVSAYNALRAVSASWEYPSMSIVRASPLVVGESVYVATEGGSVIALDLSSGREQWRYEAGENGAVFQTTPAYHDGIVYVSSHEGTLHLLDAATGSPVCESAVALMGKIATSPMISGAGVVFVGVEQGGIHAFAAGECGVPAAGHAMFYPSSRSAREGLVATDDTLYLLEDRLLMAMSLDADQWALVTDSKIPSPWGTPFAADDLITTPPVLAQETLYLGTQAGIVHAIDAATGTSLWDFDAESPLRGETVVVEGAVVVTTASGEVIAIAPKTDSDSINE